MSERNSSPEERKAFAVAVKMAIARLEMKQIDLIAVLPAGNRESNYQVVKRWVSGAQEPSRPQVLAIEELLGAPRGSLSCHLGWVPSDLLDSPSTESVVAADRSLNVEQRQALLQILRTFRDEQ